MSHTGESRSTSQRRELVWISAENDRRVSSGQGMEACRVTTVESFTP